MPGPTPWKVTEVADLRGNRLLVVQGELDIATAPEVAGLLERMRRHGHPVVLDLDGVTFIDSVGLTTLMAAAMEAERAGAAFSIRAASSAVQRVVDLCGVQGLLGIAE
jgi:anti-sigma B factor antagonist